MRKFNWKQYSKTVKIRLSRTNSSLLDLLEQKEKECYECLDHEVSNLYFEGAYRRYRRGQNRCKRCGLKALS